MELIECVHGPLDGAMIGVKEGARRIFYAPRCTEASTYSIYAGNDEDDVPAWQRERIVERYYRINGKQDARWIPL